MRTYEARWSRAAAALTVAIGVGLLSAASTSASPGVAKTTVVASGLLNPRGLAFDFLGNLYVAEGGSGGPLRTTSAECDQVPGAGPYSGGFTSRISRIDRFGRRTTVVDGLPSSATSPAVGGFVSGVADVKFFLG